MTRAAEARHPRRTDGERAAGSFLVRVWYETRELDGGAPAFRGYVKNLKTGEERFLGDPDTVKEHILCQLEGRRTGGSNGHPVAARENER